MDKACLFSVTLFFLGNLIDILRFTQERTYFSSQDYSFQNWKLLDPLQIRSNLVFHFLTTNLTSWSNLLNAFAWFGLIAPIVQLSWILSRKGRRNPMMHSYIVILVFSGSFCEFACRLMETGLEDSTRWMVLNFHLNDWETRYDGEVDGMGWRVLEMMDIATRGFLLWIDTLEWIILFQVFILIFLSLHFEPSHDKSGFPQSWAILGLITSLCCIFDFTSTLLRLDNWRLWSFVSLLLTFGNRLVLLPLWLIGLGVQLPRAVILHEERWARDKEGGNPPMHQESVSENTNTEMEINTDINTETEIEVEEVVSPDSNDNVEESTELEVDNDPSPRTIT